MYLGLLKDKQPTRKGEHTHQCPVLSTMPSSYTPHGCHLHLGCRSFANRTSSLFHTDSLNSKPEAQCELSCPRSTQSSVPLAARPRASGRGHRVAARVGSVDPLTRPPSPTRGPAPPGAAAAPLPASPGAGCRCLARWPCWPVSWRFAVASPRRPRPQRPWRRAGEAGQQGRGGRFQSGTRSAQLKELWEPRTAGRDPDTLPPAPPRRAELGLPIRGGQVGLVSYSVGLTLSVDEKTGGKNLTF